MGSIPARRSSGLGLLLRFCVGLAMFLPVPGLQARVIKGTTAGAPQQSVDSRPQQARLDRIVQLVEESNLPKLIGHEHWQTLLAEFRPRIEGAPSRRVFSRLVNDLFEATGQSHLLYYTSDDWSYWHILSTFGSDDEDTRVEHVGLFTEEIESRWFVRGVLEGSPASAQDIRVGDEIISVDGVPFEPIVSFRGKAGRPIRLRLRRKPELIYNFLVTPVKESLHKAMQRAIRESIHIIEEDGNRYAYLHAWTFLGSGSEYRELVRLQDEVDGLLWDLRDGFGGMAGRGNRFLFGSPDSDWGWHKPVVILTDDGTRSAKEMLVDVAKRRNRATLVGVPTPGHVTTVGAFRRVGDDDLLILPGRRSRLEGHPTMPDVYVERPIPYSAGKDPQLSVAKQVLRKLVGTNDPVQAFR